MEARLLQSLDDLGYDGPMLHRQTFRDAMRSGLESQDFTELLHWLATTLIDVLNLECSISSSEDDHAATSQSYHNLLALLECNYDLLMQTEDNVFATLKKRMFLLEYLCTELYAAYENQTASEPQADMESSYIDHSIDISGTKADQELQRICAVLRISQPNSTVKEIFDVIHAKVKTLLRELPEDALGNPLLTEILSEKQMAEIDEISKELTKQYTIRRQMLLTRLDVTIQSFFWSDRLKPKEAEIVEIFAPQRQNLSAESSITIGSVFSARTDLLKVCKTCSGSARASTETEVNKIIIGKVPDRGGRVDVGAAAEIPNMPQFKQRTEPSNQRGGGGGGGRGRVQGNWQKGNKGDQRNRNQNKGWGNRGSYHNKNAGGRNVFQS